MPHTIPDTKLSIRDKYFSLQKERRISRIQFFVRNITAFVAWAILIFIFTLLPIVIDALLDNRTPGIVSITMFVIALSLLPMMYAWIINMIKRAHDLGHSGTWYCLGYFFGPLVLSILLMIVGLLLLMILPSDAVAALSTISSILLCLLPLIILIMLQCRKGNPTANKYGPAPTGKPRI